MLTSWIENTATKLKALKLPPRSAGHHIITHVPIAESSQTIAQIKERILTHIGQLQSINYVYVLSKNHTLVGVFSFSQLFTSDESLKAREIMVAPVTFSHPQVDQERVAHLALKHNIKSVPIVDKKNIFLGVVPSDHIHSILYNEYREDLYKSVGIMSGSEHTDNVMTSSVFLSFKHRIPWILLGILGGVFVAKVMGLFSQTLESNLILALFIPLIVYISAAVGAQTQTIFIRDLAFNSKLPIFKYALKQAFITLLMALTCGLLVFLIVSLFWQEPFLGLVIGLAVTTACGSSAVIAILVPYLLYLFDQDPANGSGPFATILQDMLSIVIYFSTASLLL